MSRRRDDGVHFPSSMSDHADTIRRAINEGGRSYLTRRDGRRALDALLAERQRGEQKRDQLHAALREAHAERQQAIEALRELVWGPGDTMDWAHNQAHDLLVKLGEKPAE